MTGPVLVLGARGTTGSRLAACLRRQGAEVRPASRSSAPGFATFDWYDDRTWRQAVEGVESVYLVAPIGDPDPVAVARPFLEGAVRAGVGRVVLLSSSAVEPGESGLGALHQLVMDVAPDWAVLRPSWFMQNFTGDMAPGHGIRSGRVVTATGRGRVGFIDAGDIARTAAVLLSEKGPLRSEYVLTGPEAITYEDVCNVASQVLGRPIEVEHVSAETLAAHLVDSGVPPQFAAILSALDVEISRGAEDRVTNVVLEVTGQPPRSIRQVFEAELPKA